MVVAGSEQVAEDEIEEQVGNSSVVVVVASGQVVPCEMLSVFRGIEQLPRAGENNARSKQLVKLLVEDVNGTFREL